MINNYNYKSKAQKQLKLKQQQEQESSWFGWTTGWIRGGVKEDPIENIPSGRNYIETSNIVHLHVIHISKIYDIYNTHTTSSCNTHLMYV